MNKTHFMMLVMIILTTINTHGQPGGVGINTDTPRSTLEINGTLRIDSTNHIPNPKKLAVVSDSNTLDYVHTDTLIKKITDDINTKNVPDMIPLGMNNFGNPYIPMRSFYRDNDSVLIKRSSNSGTILVLIKNRNPQTKILSVDFPAVLNGDNIVNSAVSLNGYVYILVHNIKTGTRTVARYLVTNISNPPTIITFSGPVLLTNGPINSSSPDVLMSYDGTSFFFNFASGSNPNDNLISKYSLVGTNLINISIINLSGGTGLIDRYIVDQIKGFIVWTSTSNWIRQYDILGNQIFSFGTFAGQFFMNQNGSFYSFQGGGSSMFYEKFYIE